MEVLLDNNAIDKLSKNIDIIKTHTETRFFICRETVEEVSNNKSYNPTYNIISLLQLGVSYAKNAVFVLGHSKLDGHSKFSDRTTSTIYKNMLNENRSNVADAIIATTAIKNNYTLITNDKKLYNKMQKYNYKVMTFEEFLEFISNN